MRPCHLKRIWQVTQLPDGAIRQQDFYDVETDFYLWVSQEMQIIQPGLRQSSFALGIDCCRGPHPFFRRASLHFDKYQAFAFSKD